MDCIILLHCLSVRTDKTISTFAMLEVGIRFKIVAPEVTCIKKNKQKLNLDNILITECHFNTCGFNKTREPHFI